MTLRPTAFALCGLAAVGLAACDTADGPAAAPETATGVFDAALFPDADQLIATSNRPDGLDKDLAIRYRNPDALTRGATFFRERDYDVVSFQSSLFFEQTTDYYATFDIASGTGGRVARFDRRGNQLAVNDVSLIDPKGLSAFSFNLVFVADIGQSGVPFFDASSLMAVGELNEPGASNWDFHADDNSALVFGAGTDGFVNVYAGPGDPADRFQVLDVNGNPAVNLHGITYDADTQTLIVSDVGLAGSADDGAIHVLDYAPFEDGRIDPEFGDSGPNAGTPIQARATYMGANTMLGNPVDIAGSNADLFVAEKANSGGMVMRFADVLTATGMQNVAPVATSSLANPESVDTIDQSAIGGGPDGPGPGPIPLRTGSRWSGLSK